MKKILFLLTFIIASEYSFAQFPGGGFGGFGGGNGNKRETAIPGTANDNTPRGTGKIMGYLVDSAATKAVEFASIALTNLATKKVVDGTTADEKGKFALTRLATGDYKLTISFMGFSNKVVDNLKIEKGTVIDLGVVKMSASTKVLEEVTVTGQRALIEDKVDRLVYNAEKDITNKGGDATEVLRKVPLLSVDLDGNVSLKGSQSVKVLINNKPSTIIAASVADALKQIPSDMIKSVEVITSPSAKYDAEGSAGIINIITKKNNLQGLTLNIESSVGVRGANLSLNGNYRKGNMGFSLGGFGRANYNVSGRFDNTQITTGADGLKTTTTQGAETRNGGAFGQYQLGWDYDINKFNSLTASLRLGVRNQDSYQDRLRSQTVFGTNSYSSSKDVNTKDLSNTIDLNLDYTHTFKKPQQEFSILTQYSRNNRTNDFFTNNLNVNDFSILNRLKNQNDSYNQEMTIQADYQTPITKLQMIEFGVKGIFRQVASDYQYFFSPNASSEYVVSPNKLLSNTLDYNQNITAAYTSYTMSTKSRYSFKIGARYEHTDITAKLKEGAAINIPSYDVLVPSINVSKTIKGGTTFKLAYNRRIQRPSIQFLNPNINAANPLSISYGNPYLQPEYTNNYEASVNTFFGNAFLNLSVFTRNSSDAIESVRDVVGRDTIRTTYQNIGKQNATGFNVFANVNLSNKFSLGGGTDVYYATLTNNVPNPLYSASNEGWVAGYRMFSSYTIGNGWGLQAFAFFRSRQVQLQGSQGGFGIYSLSAKKDFKNKKGSIGFGAENFFASEFKIQNEINSPIIAQQSTTILRNMNFKINFSYRIGKMTFGDTKKKKSVNNDDLKDGESGGGAAAQPQPQQGGGARTGGGRPGGN